VCEYAGETLTAEEAAARAARGGNSEYIFSLDHFVREDEGAMGTTHEEGVCDDAPAGASRLLCVDAFRAGNVARFVNHAPGAEANLLLQPVLCAHRGTDRARFYRTALFACRDVPAFTELSYDYGPDYWCAASAAAHASLPAGAGAGAGAGGAEEVAAAAAAAQRVAEHAEQVAAAAASATGGGGEGEPQGGVAAQ
jgi:hypothetical protein